MPIYVWVIRLAGRTKYKNKWISENCDRISLTLQKGQKEAVKFRANVKGMSMNAYINDLIRKDTKECEK